MEDLTNIHLCPLSTSKFLDPKCVHYCQNGVQKSCECIKEHTDVAILLFNTTRNVFVFVKQFRPAIYMQNAQSETVGDQEVINTEMYPPHLGISIELCAGIVDKDEPMVKIAQAEVLEECGYNVPENKLQKITSFRNGADLCGALVHFFYAEVTDAMKVSKGGGLESEGELIDVVEMSVDEARLVIFSENVNREASFMFAVMWFLQNIWSEKNKVL